MPRTKTDRNPFGAIIETWSFRDGKRRKAYDARKRYTDADGNQKQKFKRCWTRADANTALINFANEIKTEIENAKTEKERNSRRTFAELAAHFKTHYVKPAVVVRGRKIAGYKRNYKSVERYVEEFERVFGARPLKSISYEDIRIYAENLAQTKTRNKEFPAGSVICFDDWFCYNGRPDAGEHLACREWLDKNPQIALRDYQTFHWAGKSFIVNLEK